ncbi:MAG: RimK/LysX family protein [Balneolaceae bacterium]
MRTSRPGKKIIGRIEKIDFPGWKLYNLDAKIDTGAFTSSLHCHYIKLSENKKQVFFSILDPTHPEYEDSTFRCSVMDIRPVKSSNGLSEERIVIRSKIVLAGSLYPIELSLTDRTEMRNPVLIGRKFIRKKFIVDVSKKYAGAGDG